MQFTTLSLIAASLVSASPFFGFGGPEPTVKCCLGACPTGTGKYYSIDKMYNQCGETCIDPKRYSLLHLFEPGLTASPESNSPCAEKGYAEYVNSPTHGGFGISVTLDLYKPTKKTVKELA